MAEHVAETKLELQKNQPDAALRLPFGFAILPVLLGLLFFAGALTPSLIPRNWLMQGLLGGIVMAVGYMIGRFALTIWRQMHLPVLKGRPAAIAHAVIAVPVVIVATIALMQAREWQNTIRVRMDLLPLDETHAFRIVMLALAVFIVLAALGALVQWIFDRTRRALYRVMPERTANVAGLVIVVLGLIFLTRDGLIDYAIATLDQSYETAQELFENAPPMPTDPRIPGSAVSELDWEAMGQPGRNFVTGGPDAAAIERFTGEPALEPIRVYVGRAEHEDPWVRAERALAELIRLDAFDREILIVTMPTGTGWLDPGSHDVVEYMHGGDVATVAAQYSYMQSPLTLIFETQAGLEQGRALVRTVHEYWRGLPPDTRPRLYIHGLSLGAWSSMYAADFFALLDDPIDGAFWAGPPFPSALWNRAMALRNPGTPYVAPKVEDGRLIRFASATKGAGGPEGWSQLRLIFLQYSSDPIVFYEPGAIFMAPTWMREPPASDVSPALRFIPIVTQFQLAVDLALSTAAPGGHGHSYWAPDYIGPWVALTAPEGWTEADSQRLTEHCDAGFQLGCDNDE